MCLDKKFLNNYWDKKILKIRFYCRLYLVIFEFFTLITRIGILHVNDLCIPFRPVGFSSLTRISWTTPCSRSSSESNSHWTLTTSIFKIGWSTSASCTFNERFTAQQLLMDSHVHCVLIILTFCSFQYVIYLLWRNQYYIVIFIENEFQKCWALFFNFIVP